MSRKIQAANFSPSNAVSSYMHPLLQKAESAGVILAVSCFARETLPRIACSSDMPPRLMNQMEFAHLFELVEKWFWAVLILVAFLNAAALIPCDCEVAERCNNEPCLL